MSQSRLKGNIAQGATVLVTAVVTGRVETLNTQHSLFILPQESKEELGRLELKSVKCLLCQHDPTPTKNTRCDGTHL